MGHDGLQRVECLKLLTPSGDSKYRTFSHCSLNIGLDDWTKQMVKTNKQITILMTCHDWV